MRDSGTVTFMNIPPVAASEHKFKIFYAEIYAEKRKTVNYFKKGFSLNV